MIQNNFYDTSSLLLLAEETFSDPNHKIIISSITLSELEHIKTSAHKDAAIKYEARKLIKLLDKYYNDIEIITYQEKMILPIVDKDLEVNNDAKIIACALSYPLEVIFYTNDISLKNLAGLFFDEVKSVKENDYLDEYTGYLEVHLTNEEMATYYSSVTDNVLGLLPNQYANLYNEDNQLVDTVIWTGKENQSILFKSLRTKWFGKIKPMEGDPYQKMVLDSFFRNTITMVKGPAGSGKTWLSLGFLMGQLEDGKIDKIIIFCNTVATKNSARLGFYPGTRNEKLLDSQIGNLLVSKLGSRMHVEELIEEEKIVLLPMSDIRGYDTSGMNAGIYISEAQNLDVSLMKLALQRIGSDSICIIDGDEKTQVDDIAFAGANNGMRRLSQVFRGEDIYGEIQLKNIHRSHIGQIAERM